LSPKSCAVLLPAAPSWVIVKPSSPTSIPSSAAGGRTTETRGFSGSSPSGPSSRERSTFSTSPSSRVTTGMPASSNCGLPSLVTWADIPPANTCSRTASLRKRAGSLLRASSCSTKLLCSKVSASPAERSANAVSEASRSSIASGVSRASCASFSSSSTCARPLAISLASGSSLLAAGTSPAVAPLTGVAIAPTSIITAAAKSAPRRLPDPLPILPPLLVSAKSACIAPKTKRTHGIGATRGIPIWR